jgi:hypothetical protein
MRKLPSTAFKPGQSGNPNGRPPKPEIAQLREALELAKKKKKTSFLNHFVLLAYEDNNVAIALAKKILPDLSESEQHEFIKVMTMPTIKRDGKEVDFNVGS